MEAVLIPVIEPLLNPVWVFLMLGEAPGLMAIIGGFIVLSAITVRCVLAALTFPTKEGIRSLFIRQDY